MIDTNVVELQKETTKYSTTGKAIAIKREYSDGSYSDTFFKYSDEDGENSKVEATATCTYDSLQRKISETLVIDHKSGNPSISNIPSITIQYEYRKKEKENMLDEINSVKITCQSEYGCCITQITYSVSCACAIWQEVLLDGVLIGREMIAVNSKSHRTIISKLMGYFTEDIRMTSKGLEVIVTSSYKFWS